MGGGAEMSLDAVQEQALIAAAFAAAENAYAPYSDYPVGAALLFDDGAVITGCNVENASYGLALCAETVAVAKAFDEGRRGGLLAVAVVGLKADAEPITPFMDRIGPLHRQLGVSTVLVAGGSSAFFEAADHVIAMESYQPRDATAQVRQLIAEQPAALEEGDDELFPHGVARVLPAGCL